MSRSGDNGLFHNYCKFKCTVFCFACREFSGLRMTFITAGRDNNNKLKNTTAATTTDSCMGFLANILSIGRNNNNIKPGAEEDVLTDCAVFSAICGGIRKTHLSVCCCGF